MHNVIDIVPQTMILSDMMLKSLCLFIKCKPIETANEACILLIIFFTSFFLSQLGKSINNDTKENIEQDNFDQDMETCVMYQFDEVHACIPFEVD